MRRLAIVSSVAIFLSCLISGCGPEPDSTQNLQDVDVTLKFVFDSANELNRGSRVVCRGTQVGTVVEKPEISSDGEKVTVVAQIDGLSPEHKHLINRNMTATISKDSLVAGDSQLTLHFSKREAPVLQAGDIVEGCSSWAEFKAWQMHNRTTGNMASRLAGLLFEMDKSKIGIGIYYLNIACFAMFLISLVSMAIDGFLRLLQGKERTKSSPSLLRWAWTLFVILAGIKIVYIISVFICAVAGVQLPHLDPMVIVSDRPVAILKYNLNFIIAFAVMVAIKLKLDLFTNIVRYAVAG